MAQSYGQFTTTEPLFRCHKKPSDVTKIAPLLDQLQLPQLSSWGPWFALLLVRWQLWHYVGGLGPGGVWWARGGREGILWQQ